MKNLSNKLVIVTGISGTGKTTVLNEVLKEVPNAFILEKDAINQGFLHISQSDHLKDGFLTEGKEIETPYGKMLQIPFNTNYYGRHVRDQTYICMTLVAKKNLEFGKVPIIDCMVIRQIKDGTVKRFMRQESFKNCDKYLIHFMCSKKDLYLRVVERAEKDPFARERDKNKISSYKNFQKFLTEQPMTPKELNNYNHLLIDTSLKSPEENSKKIIDHICI